jgi:ribonuclease-3
VSAAYLIVRKQHGLPPAPTPSSSPRSSPERQSESADLSTTTIGHLALFNQYLQKHNRQVEWIYSDMGYDNGDPNVPEGTLIKGTKTTPVWFVKVIVDGELYGKGRGNTKKAARNEAAKVGLELMGVFVW